MIRYLALDDLLTIVERYGLQAVRDVGLLDSAAHRPQTSLFGEDAYPSIEEKAAVLLESIVRNHPLIDDNLRLGWIAAVMLIEQNGFRVDAPHDEAYDLVIGVAEGRLDYPVVAAALAAWTT